MEGRLVHSEQRKEWSYEHEVRELDSRNKTKYQDVEMTHKVPFLEDMQQIIYDTRLFKEDEAFFTQNSGWKMVGFEQMDIAPLKAIPSAACIRVTGQGGEEVQEYWGRLEMEGRLHVKINDTAYAPMQFNLRRRAITFYPIAEAETQTK